MNNTYTENQFILSPELLQLMQWIVQYEPEAFKRIITRALTQGLKQGINQNDAGASTIHLEQMQQNFTDFIELMELLLSEVINERALKNAFQRNLLPALEHIDITACDESTIKSSLAIATSKMERNPQANPKELLYQELLKNWNPHKKNLSH